MKALIVVSHPNANSLTHSIARSIARGVTDAGHEAAVADLAAENFDPRFIQADIDAHLRVSAPPRDVLKEQERIAPSNALVLVYPVYWWSFPSLLKGWIDRVFTNGWAYHEGTSIPFSQKLGHLPVHLVALAGASERTYARYGYFGAMRKQIDQGVFDYCGAPVLRHELLIGSGDNAEKFSEFAHGFGTSIFHQSEAMLPEMCA